MHGSGGGGGGGTIVVDIGGVRRGSALLADDAHAYAELAARVRSHALPSMPDDVGGRVAAVLGEVGGSLRSEPETLVQLARELRVRAFWAEIADKLIGGYDLTGAQLNEVKAAYASALLTRYAEPWQADLAKAYAKEVHDREHPGGIGGFFKGVGDVFSGAWDAIKDPAVMIYHLTPFSGGDWTKAWGDLGHGLSYGVTHPVEFGKALVNLDALHERGFGYWLRNLTPAIAATLLSGGAAAGVRGAEAVAGVDRVAEGAAALDRAADGAAAVDRAADGATALDRAVSNAARFGTASTNDYRDTFFLAHPDLRGNVVVHHAVEQQVQVRYPGVVSDSKLHSLDNLRGIPKEINSDVHLSEIRKEWNRFYRTHPEPTQQQLLDKATEIDDKYGTQFKPPVR